QDARALLERRMGALHMLKDILEDHRIHAAVAERQPPGIAKDVWPRTIQTDRRPRIVEPDVLAARGKATGGAPIGTPDVHDYSGKARERLVQGRRLLTTAEQPLRMHRPAAQRASPSAETAAPCLLAHASPFRRSVRRLSGVPRGRLGR